MRFAKKADGCARNEFGFTKSRASFNTRLLSYRIFFSLLIAVVGGGMSAAQAQSSTIYQGAGGKWFSTVDAVAQSVLEFRRFYNSANATQPDMGVGCSHSYSRSISANFYPTIVIAASGYSRSAVVSAQYSDPATACAYPAPSMDKRSRWESNFR